MAPISYVNQGKQRISEKAQTDKAWRDNMTHKEPKENEIITLIFKELESKQQSQVRFSLHFDVISHVVSLVYCIKDTF